jgi:hypothetical protein
MADEPGTPNIEERFRCLEERAERDRAELEALRAQVARQEDNPLVRALSVNVVKTEAAPKAEEVTFGPLRIVLWLLAFVAGAAMTYVVVVHELHWHWIIGVVLALVGGVLAIIVGELAVIIGPVGV